MFTYDSLRGGCPSPWGGGSQVCAAESVKGRAVPVSAAARDADEVEEAPG